MCPLSSEPSHTAKAPKAVLNSIFAFLPNRNTLGGTAYLILEKEGNILVDCPALDNTNLDFLHFCQGVDKLFISHRGGIGDAVKIQQIFGCDVIIQEQEAYLLPEIPKITFSEELNLNSQCQAIWTPGHSPGSSCLYYNQLGGVLFSGRSILPNLEGKPMPLRTDKTFHWNRQLKSFESLLQRFAPEIAYLCPGANTGFIRGQGVIKVSVLSGERGLSFLTLS